METLDDNFKSNDSFVISHEIKEHLLEIAKWAKFLSIFGFIGLGLAVLASLFMLILGTPFETFSGVRGATYLYALILIIMAVLYFFPLNYLYKSSLGLKKGINSNNQNLLASGFKNLKSHYKFLGILTIVVFSIYLLIFLGAMVVLFIFG